MTELQVVEVQEDGGSVEESLRAAIRSFEVISVVDAESFSEAGERDKKLTELKNGWSAYWENIKKSAHATWKGIVAKEKDVLDIADQKKAEQKKLAMTWFEAEEKKRLAAERIAQEAARKQAEDEALARAEALEKDGNKEEAAAVIAEPMNVPQVVVKSSVPAGYGKMTQKHYSATVTDIKALARAVLDGKVPSMAIVGNDVFLNSQARMMKETMNYPGVVVNVK